MNGLLAWVYNQKKYTNKEDEISGSLSDIQKANIAKLIEMLDKDNLKNNDLYHLKRRSERMKALINQKQKWSLHDLH